MIVVAATALMVVVVAAVLVLTGALGTGASGVADPPCSSYPAPGALAPASTDVPASLAARYSLLSRPQRAVDRPSLAQIASAITGPGMSTSATGLIMSGTRFLGNAAAGGRIYLVPAQHLLAFRLAPLHCLPANQRALERRMLPRLRSEYRHTALCVVVLYQHGRGGSCAATSGNPGSLLFASGTPGFGLVPDGVSAVTVTYETSPPRTVAVHDNFFAVVAPTQTALPCGVQWLDSTGNVSKIVAGCSYVKAEIKQLYKYRSYVASELSALAPQVAALAAAVGSGNREAAQAAWLTAHLTWLRIGQDDGAYGAFGALGGKIDGLAAGHPLGTADPGFTGFHRVEFDLWTKHDLHAAVRDTATLKHLLTKLQSVPLSTYLPATPTGVGSWVLRPHEVLEDALRDSLTGNDDYGSGTGLASIVADTAAVRELLSVLDPVLDPLAPHLARRASSELIALLRAVDRTRVNGAWVSVKDLAARQRQQVNAEIGTAVETLAPVPNLLTSTGHNAPAD